MTSKAAGFAALVALSLPSYAGGGGEIRSLANASIAPCDSGSLKEHFFHYGNISTNSDMLAIACLSSKDYAEWILLAARDCSNNNLCLRKKFVPFAVPQGHFLEERLEGQTSPPMMRYNLYQYAMGRRCKIESYKRDEGDANFFWNCETYKTETLFNQAFVIYTNGPRAQVSDDNPDAPKIPTFATLPVTEYTFEEN